MLTTSTNHSLIKPAKLEAWNEAPHDTFKRLLPSGTYGTIQKECELHCKQIAPQADYSLNRQRTADIPLHKPQSRFHGDDSTTRVNCMSEAFNMGGSLTKQEATVRMKGKPDAAGGPV